MHYTLMVIACNLKQQKIIFTQQYINIMYHTKTKLKSSLLIITKYIYIYIANSHI